MVSKNDKALDDVEAEIEQIDRDDIEAGDEVIRAVGHWETKTWRVDQRGVAKNAPTAFGQVRFEGDGSLKPSGDEVEFYRVL